MNISGVLKQQIAAHPAANRLNLEVGVLRAYHAAEREFTGKWTARSYEAAFNAAMLLGLGGHRIIFQGAAILALGVGEAMRWVPPVIARLDTGRQIDGHHFAPDAPDSRFAARTAQLAEHFTLH